MIRVGIGYDSHRFGAPRPLILGGVEIPHTSGLIGHSDADAVAHALTDAILGAAALGDIGRHFPDSDPAFANANSLDLLVEAHKRVRQTGWSLAQADVTVILEAPKLSPFIEEMRSRLGARLGVPVGSLSVKAKTNERMGWIGRGEGVAVMAVATLQSFTLDPITPDPILRFA